MKLLAATNTPPATARLVLGTVPAGPAGCCSPLRADRSGSQTRVPERDSVSRSGVSAAASGNVRGFAVRAGCSGSQTRVPKRTTTAFTLAEVLAALVFLAIVIPVAIQGLSLAGRAGEVAVRKGEASLIGEKVLNESVITTNWNQNTQSGSVRQSGRNYHWTLRNQSWGEDPNESAIRLLSVEVTYTAQGQDFSTRLWTLVDSTPPTTSTQTSQTVTGL